VKWKLVSVHFKIVIILMHDSAHLLVLLGDIGQVEARLGMFGDSVNLGAR
jgi:hypothetical protein